MLELALFVAKESMVIVALRISRGARHPCSETDPEIGVKPSVQPLTDRIGEDAFYHLVFQVAWTKAVAVGDVKLACT